MLAVAHGKDPAAEKRAERSAGTFTELQRYVEHHAKKRNRSWRQADKLDPPLRAAALGQAAGGGITRGDVKAMMSQIEAPGRSPIRPWRRRRAVFAWAVKEEIVAANPASGSTATRPRAASASCPIARCRSSGRRSTTPAWSPARR